MRLTELMKTIVTNEWVDSLLWYYFKPPNTYSHAAMFAIGEMGELSDVVMRTVSKGDKYKREAEREDGDRLEHEAEDVIAMLAVAAYHLSPTTEEFGYPRDILERDVKLTVERREKDGVNRNLILAGIAAQHTASCMNFQEHDVVEAAIISVMNLYEEMGGKSGLKELLRGFIYRKIEKFAPQSYDLPQANASCDLPSVEDMKLATSLGFMKYAGSRTSVSSVDYDLRSETEFMNPPTPNKIRNAIAVHNSPGWFVGDLDISSRVLYYAGVTLNRGGRGTIVSRKYSMHFFTK